MSQMITDICTDVLRMSGYSTKSSVSKTKILNLNFTKIFHAAAIVSLQKNINFGMGIAEWNGAIHM